MSQLNKFIVAAIFALCGIAIPNTLFAQMTIDNVSAKEEKANFRDTLRRSKVEGDYFSLAKYRAERAAIRKERNTLEIISSLQGSMSALSDSWIKTSGGENTIAVVGSFNLNHTFTKDLFSLNTRFNARFGYNRVKIETGKDEDENPISDGVWFKNQDELRLSVAPSFKLSKNWSYGATVSFRSQIASGYVSRAQQEDIHLKSTFLAPGYFDISGGLTYKSPSAKLPFTVNISPIAMSAIYVSNEAIRYNFLYQFKDHTDGSVEGEANNYKYVEPYGVSPYENSKYEGGSSVQIYFDRTFGKSKMFRYKTTVFSFYGWMTQVTHKNIISNYDEYHEALAAWDKKGVKPILSIHPNVRWENTIMIQATKVLATTINFQLYYNRAQSQTIQTQTMLSVGLAYTFKNK